MYNTVRGDAVFFLTCIGVGILTAFLYDIIRISRRIVSVNASVVCGEDILFFAVSAVILFYAAYLKNSGEVRWQGFLGGLLGAGGYALLIRNRFVNLGTVIVKWLIKAVLALFKAVALPIRIVLRVLKKPISIVAWYTGRGLRRVKRVTKCQSTRAKMRLLAARAQLRKK